MRDDQRNPVPRGTVLVADGETGPAGTAHPPVNAVPATESDHDPAVTGRSAPAAEPGNAVRTGGAGAAPRGGGGPGGGGGGGGGGAPRGAGGGRGAARADEVPGPSDTTHQATDPRPATDPDPSGGEPPASGAGAAAGTERAEGAVAQRPGQTLGPSNTGTADPATATGAGTTTDPAPVTGAGTTPSPSGPATEAAPGGAAPGGDHGDGAGGESAHRAGVQTPRRTPPAPAAEPSRGQGLGPPGPGSAATADGRPRRSGIRWPLVVFVLVLVILALVGLQLSGALTQTSKSRNSAGSTGSGSGSSESNQALSAAQAVRSKTATWISQQVTASAEIACDQLMCSALEADGVAAARLMTVEPTTPDPLGADVVVATSSIRSQFGSALTSEYAPQLVASFGRGANRVDVRAVAPDGAAAFRASERLDLAQRKSAGAQLIRHDSLIGEKDASAIRSGQVDSRLLVTLAFLLSQRPVDVGSFEDTAPGAPILYREVTIVDAPRQVGTAALQADLSQVQTQPSSFRPLHASVVQLANGQSALRITFGAPDPPGLLSGGGDS